MRVRAPRSFYPVNGTLAKLWTASQQVGTGDTSAYNGTIVVTRLRASTEYAFELSVRVGDDDAQLLYSTTEQTCGTGFPRLDRKPFVQARARHPL